MIHIKVEANYTDAADKKWLRNACQTTLKTEKVKGRVSLTILVSTNEAIQKLNHQFRGLDEPTDVLSFPSDYLDLETGEKYLGDLMIALPKAEAQAAAGGHTLKGELELLVVHGTLHLLGYDHSEESEKALMWQKQKAILQLLENPCENIT